MILALTCLAAAAGIFALHDSTQEKTRRLRRVRGEIAGANFMDARIVDLDSRDGKSGGRIFWGEFGFEHEKMKTTHRKEVSRVIWSGLKDGNSLRVTRLKDDPQVYVPIGTWASTENLEIALGLRALERFGIIFLTLLGLCSARISFFVKPTPRS